MTELPGTVPLLVVGLLLLVSVWWDGAFDLRYWAPLTLVSLAMLLALALAGTISLPRRGPLALSLGAIWAFAAYTMLSAAWSASPGDAWEGGIRAVFYAALFSLAVAAPSGPRGRGWVGAGLVVGVALTGLVTELRLLDGQTGAFLGGRLNEPIGYRNGTAALFSFAAWPLLGHAARRGFPSGLRAAALALAALTVGLAFLTQSRGILIGLVCGGAVSLAIGPDRLRRCWLGVALVALVALGSEALLTPYHGSGSGTGAAGADDVRHAALALALLCAGSFVVGLLAFVFDNGLRVGGLARAVRTAAAAGLVGLLAATLAVGVAKVGDPVGYAGDRWEEFSQLEAGSANGSRLGTVGGPRYDIWRVALDQFRETPVAGAGQGSFRFAYYRDRQTDRNVADAHSLPLRLLAETGLIGFGLLALWLAGLAVAVARRARRAQPRQRAAVAGLAAAGTAVLAQSAVDWLWLIPSLFGLAIFCLGLAARGQDEPEPDGIALALRASIAIGLVAAVFGAGTLFMSDVYVRKARSEAPSSPQRSLAAARTAATLAPLSVTPLYLQAGALESRGGRSAARAALRDALDLEPSNFVTLGLLGDLEVRAGNEAAARRYYRRALALNPRDTGLRELSRGEGS